MDDQNDPPAPSNGPTASEPVGAPAAPADVAPAPAPAPPTETHRLIGLAALPLLIFLWAITNLWGIGAYPFHTKGEPREGLVVWEMTHDGGWILPRRNGTELPSKPPLFHWLGAATSLARGTTDEWSIRFPSAALSLAGILMVFFAGTALWNSRAGLVAGLSLLTTFEWSRAATNARVDMTLAFGLEAAFLSLLFFWRSRHPRWLIGMYFGITWAVLGKGPVGIALPGAVALILVLLTFRVQAVRQFAWANVFDLSLLRDLRLVWGGIAVVLIAGSWYGLALLNGGSAFFRKQILAENLFTFVDSADFGGGHRHGPFYMPGQLALGLLPWTIFLPGLVARLWRERSKLTLSDPRVYLLVWVGVVFTFFEIAASKRGVYLLSLYPAVAMLLGWWWHEQAHQRTAFEWQATIVRWTVGILGAVLVVAALAILAHTFGAPLLEKIRSHLEPQEQQDLTAIRAVLDHQAWTLIAALTAMAILLWGTARATAAARWWLGFSTLTTCVIVGLMTTRLVVLPEIALHQTRREFITAVREMTNGPLSFYKTFDYGVVYYSQGHIPVYDGPLDETSPENLIMDHDEWEALPDDVGAIYKRAAVRGDSNVIDHQQLVFVRRRAGG